MAIIPELTKDQLLKYFNRIKIKNNHTEPTLQLLNEIHANHVLNIPFENIRLLLLRINISIEISDIFNNLIIESRGGYCFQHNIIFASVLKTLGYYVELGFSRVSRYQQDISDYTYKGMTHMILFVRLSEKLYLVDVGFGGNGINQPMEIFDGSLMKCPGGEWHSIVKGDLTTSGGWYLLHKRNPMLKPSLGSDSNGWAKCYYFTLETGLLTDYDIFNFYAYSCPTFAMNCILFTSRMLENGKSQLLNNVFKKREFGTEIIQTIKSAQELDDLLKSEFGIQMDESEMISAELFLNNL